MQRKIATPWGKRVACAVCLGALFGAGAVTPFPDGGGIVTRAQASDTTTLRAVALHRTGESYKKWHWLDERLKEATDGRYALNIVTADELGMSGTEFLRVLRTGTIDLAEITTGYVAGDFPLIEAPELPAIASDYEEYKAISEAWMDNVVAANEERMGGKVIASFAWGPMHLYSSFPMNDLEDLRGKTIRVFSSSQAKYLEALGAEPMSLPMTEVYGALQRGLIDGMVTGAEHISRMSLWETTSHVSDIGIAPATGHIVISQRTWNGLPDDVQEVILAFADELTDEGWRLGARNAEEGFAIAERNGMNLEHASMPDEWWERLKNVSEEAVLPWWPTRIGDGAMAKSSFNEYLSPLTGTRID